MLLKRVTPAGSLPRAPDRADDRDFIVIDAVAATLATPCRRGVRTRCGEVGEARSGEAPEACWVWRGSDRLIAIEASNKGHRYQ